MQWFPQLEILKSVGRKNLDKTMMMESKVVKVEEIIYVYATWKNNIFLINLDCFKRYPFFNGKINIKELFFSKKKNRIITKKRQQIELRWVTIWW